MRRKIIVYAVNDKYKDIAYHCYPPYDPAKNKYFTGQEDLSPEELKNEPFIIPLDEEIILSHRQELMVGDEKEPRTKDDVLYAYFCGLPEVARNERERNADSLFFLSDPEKMAQVEVTHVEKMYDALTKVKENMTTGAFKELGIFLDIPVNIYTNAQLQDKIYQACSNTPEKVLSYFGPNTKDELFVRKLIYYGILENARGKIKVKGTEVHVGDNVMEAINYIRNAKNSEYVQRWGTKLDEFETSNAQANANTDGFVVKKNGNQNWREKKKEEARIKQEQEDLEYKKAHKGKEESSEK